MADLKTTNIYGDLYVNNEIGIGTNVPATRLQIGQLSPTAATEGIQFGDDTSTRLYRSSAGTLTLIGGFAGLTLSASTALYGNYGDWSGESNKIQWHSNNLYFVNRGGGSWLFRNSGGSNVVDIASNGTTTVAGNISAANLSGTNTGDQTVGNGTITIAAGTGVGVGTTNTFTTNQSGATTVTISNSGVTSNVAGTGISVSGATGAVTITNSSPNATHTGDVTGATALTIANDAVTTAKILNANVTNVKLANSSLTIGSTAISLGATATTIAGLTSVTSTTFVGALTGNASTATALTSMNISQFTNNSGYLTSAVTSLAGTTNRITVSGATGAVTLNLPQDIHTGASPTFSGLTVTGITMTNLTGAYQNTTVYDSPRTQSATPSRGIRAPASSIQFTDSYAIAPFYTYRSTGDWPVPYGIGWGTGGESSGIFQRYASNGSSFGDMIFYTGNDGSGAFSFRRHTWEGTTYFAAGSGELNTELFRIDWSGNLTMLGTLNGSANSATLYANNGSYGAWAINGTRNGWGGIEFANNGVSLMMGSDTVGFHQNTNGWLFRVHQGIGYIYKGSWGGGTAATILDSSNAAYAWNMNQNVRTTDNVTFGTVTAALSGNATTATNANAVSFTEVELNAPVTVSGTWSSGNGSEWGEPKFGTSFNQFRYTDGNGPYVEYNIPANHHACFISQLQWDTGGYADCHGVQSDGDLVFLRRINTRQLVENSNHGNTIQHDGTTISFIGSGLQAFTKIRITNRSGRIHMTGIAFTRQVDDGYEGTGMVHPAQISHQGSGSGLDADLLDGYNPATANTANTIVLRDGSGNFSAGTITATLSGNATTATSISGFGNPTTNSTANTIVYREGNGYITNNYFHTSGGGSERNASGMTYFAGFNSSDYYIRSYTAAAVATLISGQTMNINGSSTSCTGNAATATTTDNINGRAFFNRNSGNPLAQDSYTNNGIGYVTGVSLFSQTDGGMYASAYDTSWIHQIYGDFRTGQIAIRGKNSGTWQAWRRVLDETNASFAWNMNQNVRTTDTCSFAGLTVSNTINGSVTGNAATATTATSAGSINSDTGNVGENRLQYWQTSGNTVLNPDGEWYNAIRMGHGNPVTYYGNTLAIRMTGGNLGDIYTRTTTNGVTGSWNRFWHNNNDGAGSGLDADLLDGYASTTANTVNTIVLRDGSGNFSAGTVTAALSGNATTATSISGFGNPTTAASANTIAYRDGNGDLTARYFFGSYQNSSDDINTGNISHIMAKFGDNYHRSATAAKVAAFITGQTMNINGSSTSCSGNAATATALTSMNISQFTNNSGYLTSVTNISGNAATATLATKASTLSQGGANGTGMTFNWSGQSGQPTWLWGSNDGTNIYVWNPSNFNVNSATTATTATNSTQLGGVAAASYATLTGTQTLSNKTVSGTFNATGNITENSTTQTNISGALTINVSAANVHVISLTNGANVTSITYNNRAASPSVNTLILVLKYAGSATVSWTNVVWANGTAPTLTGVNGFADVYALTSYQGGAATPVWIGTVVSQNLVSTNL